MAWSMLAVLVNSCMKLLLTPYVIRNIGVGAYGYVSLAVTFTSYIDIISVSLNAFAGRFISMAYHGGDLERANRYYSSTIMADLLLSAAALVPGALVIACLGPVLNVPDALTGDVRLLFAMMLLKYLLTIMRTAFDTAAFIADRLDLAEKKQSISCLIQAGVLFAACGILPPHVWYVGAAAAAAALYLLAANYRLCRRLTPKLSCTRGAWSFAAVKEIAAAGIWTSLNNLGNVLNSGLDLLITDLMLDAAALGGISVAKNLVLLCSVIVMKLSDAFRPRMLQLYAEKRMETFAGLCQTAIGIVGITCSFITGMFYICGYDFLALWLPGQDTEFLFKASMIVFLGDMAPAAVKPLYYVYTLTKRVKAPCMITLLMGSANVIAMYLLIRFTDLGPYAVILTTLAVNLIHFMDAPLYSAHCLGIPLTSFYPAVLRHLLGMGCGFLAAGGLKHIMPEAGSWVGLAAKGAVSGVLLASLLAAVWLLSAGIWKGGENR